MRKSHFNTPQLGNSFKRGNTHAQHFKHLQIKLQRYRILWYYDENEKKVIRIDQVISHY